MIAIVKSSVAPPCAWLWVCPECDARVVVMNNGAGLRFQNPPCSHAITPEREGHHVQVKYADSE